MQANYVLSKVIPSQDLFEIYYQLSPKVKHEYLQRFIQLIKDFHNDTQKQFGKIMTHQDVDFTNHCCTNIESSKSVLL